MNFAKSHAAALLGTASFSIGYDLDLGNTGVFNAGLDGTYFLHPRL
jgi:hypothetical protein